MKRKLSIIYKIITLISLMSGIVLDILDKDLIIIASYFTLQSNIICFVAIAVFFCLEIFKVKYKNNIYYILKGAITIAIALTMALYHINIILEGKLLIGINDRDLSTILLHTISPLLVILDYFIFDEKGKFKMYYPAFWLVIPSIYVVYVYIYSYFGGTYYRVGGSVKFAYFFLDYQKIGVCGVIKWIICIITFIFYISHLLVLFDRKRGKAKKRL